MVRASLKVKLLCALLISLVILLSLIYVWFYILGFFIGLSSLLFLIFALLTLITKFLLFPGSSRLWRLYWQSFLETELLSNFLEHLQILQTSLSILQSSSNPQSLKKNSAQLHDSLEMLSVLTSNYRSLPAEGLTKSQKTFIELCNDLHKHLSETVLVFPNGSGTALEVLDHAEGFDWSNVTFEDFPENGNVRSSLEAFETLEVFLRGNPGGWLQEGIFSNLSILRLILESSCVCEHYWVSSEDGEIDCMVVRNCEESTDVPVVIYCNPNGGLYEYTCYQNQWLEFYINQKIDLCLWNYRGYGRNKGTPTAHALKADGQAIYDFLTKVKMYEKIGVHGESIGGMVASHISKHNHVDFVFADRTFSNLSLLVTCRTRFVNKYLFQCLSRWDDQTAKDYFESNCYKVLSCDSRDQMIPEPASLKMGVASTQNCGELDNKTLVELFEAIKGIREYAQYVGVKETKDSRLDITHNSMYVLAGKESEVLEDDNSGVYMLKVYSSIEIDAGGVCLYDVKSTKDLENWVKIFQVWGSFLPIGSSSVGRDKAFHKLNKSIQTLTEICSECEFIVNNNIVNISRQARLIKSALVKISSCLQNYHKTSTEELTIRDEDGNEVNSIGYLLPINCGHNGKYSEEEKKLLIHHLKQAKFLQ